MIMISKLRVIIIAILISSVGMIALSGAVPTNPARMQQHVDKVKITHPKEYQEMMEKAGGVIEGCTSCHKDLKTKKAPSEYKYPRYPR